MWTKIKNLKAALPYMFATLAATYCPRLVNRLTGISLEEIAQSNIENNEELIKLGW